MCCLNLESCLCIDEDVCMKSEFYAASKVKIVSCFILCILVSLMEYRIGSGVNSKQADHISFCLGRNVEMFKEYLYTSY